MNNTTEVPEHISCPECKDEGKYIMHAFFAKDLPDGEWSWHLMNHDKTSKFQWPTLFPTKDAAQKHLFGLMEYED